MNIKKYVAELIGTAVLVLVGCGSAVFLGCAQDGGHLAVALAFGLSIVAMAYVIGNISGCHINPAVSLAMLLTKKLSVIDFVGYVVAQIVGAFAGAGIIALILNQTKIADQTIADNIGGLGSNGFTGLNESGNGILMALVIEIVLTFIFIFTILGVTNDESKSGVAGIVIGLTLTFVHIIGIPLTGTSVNPARSIGPAVLAGGVALEQLWVFIVAPLAGATLAVGAYLLLKNKKAADAK